MLFCALMHLEINIVKHRVTVVTKEKEVVVGRDTEQMFEKDCSLC